MCGHTMCSSHGNWQVDIAQLTENAPLKHAGAARPGEPDERRRSVPLGGQLGIARHQDPQRHVGENLRARKHHRRDDDEPDDERVPVIPAGEAAPTPAIHFPRLGRVKPRSANHARAPASDDSLGSAAV